MKQRIRLTESDLHKIVKESVENILMEYTNGWTEDMYDKMGNGYDDGGMLGARKKRAADYLAQRWQRENNVSDEDLPAFANQFRKTSKFLPAHWTDNRDEFANSNLTANQLRNINRADWKAKGAKGTHSMRISQRLMNNQ